MQNWRKGLNTHTCTVAIDAFQSVSRIQWNPFTARTPINRPDFRRVLNQVSFVHNCHNWDTRKCPYLRGIHISGVFALRGSTVYMYVVCTCYAITVSSKVYTTTCTLHLSISPFCRDIQHFWFPPRETRSLEIICRLCCIYWDRKRPLLTTKVCPFYSKRVRDNHVHLYALNLHVIYFVVRISLNHTHFTVMSK